MEQINEIIQSKLRDLEADARKVVNRFWEFYYQENPKRPIQEKSVLGLRFRKRGNSLSLEWVRTKWTKRVKEDGKRELFTFPLPKRRDKHSYDITALAKWGQDWEMPLVEELEKEAAVIRQKAKILVDMAAVMRRWETAGKL